MVSMILRLAMEIAKETGKPNVFEPTDGEFSFVVPVRFGGLEVTAVRTGSEELKVCRTEGGDVRFPWLTPKEFRKLLSDEFNGFFKEAEARPTEKPLDMGAVGWESLAPHVFAEART